MCVSIIISELIFKLYFSYSSTILQQLLLPSARPGWPPMVQHPAQAPRRPPGSDAAGKHPGSEGPRAGEDVSLPAKTEGCD